MLICSQQHLTILLPTDNVATMLYSGNPVIICPQMRTFKGISMVIKGSKAHFQEYFCIVEMYCIKISEYRDKYHHIQLDTWHDDYKYGHIQLETWHIDYKYVHIQLETWHLDYKYGHIQLDKNDRMITGKIWSYSAGKEWQDDYRHKYGHIQLETLTAVHYFAII